MNEVNKKHKNRVVKFELCKNRNSARQ